jgi:1-pyrroline-5-carboxylate dehydrogenase
MKVTRPRRVARSIFRSEGPTDFSKTANRRAMEGSLRRVEKELGREYPLIIGGCEISTRQKIESRNPSHPYQVIGIFQQASVEMAGQAVEAASRAFEFWKDLAVNVIEC